MDERGPLDGIMQERIFAELEEFAMIEFGRVAMRMRDVDFTAADRQMFVLGFAACLMATTRE